MSFPDSPPRSVLYAPAHSTALFDAAVAARPDAVIVDLEDGVPADHKAVARLGLEHLAARVRDGGVGLIVRVNAVDTEWFHDDVAAALAARPDAIMLPKATIPDIAALAQRMDDLGHVVGVWAMVESAHTVLTVDDLASCGPVQALTIGYGDLCTELGLPLGSEHPEFAGVRTLVVAAARKHDRWPIDGVVVARPDNVEPLCRQSADLGFVGRTLYDPRHVPGCRAAFAEQVAS